MTLERRFAPSRPFVWPSFAVALAALCLFPANAHAQTTALFLDSGAGEALGGGVQRTYFPGSGATFQATVLSDNGVEVKVTDPSFGWTVGFRTADKTPLQTGHYYGATRYPFAPGVTMNVSRSGNGGTCNSVTGRYWVREIVVSGTTVQKLAIDFEQHCNDMDPALFGVVRYNSTIASLIPFDGDYPRYRIEVATVNGAVTAADVDCHGAGPVCAVDYAEPQPALTLQAVPDPGFYVTGWSGSCHGGIATTFRLNTTEQCSARFTALGEVPPRLLMLNSSVSDYIGQGRQQILNDVNAVWTAVAEEISSLTGRRNTLDIVAQGLGGDFIDPYVRISLGAPTGASLTPGNYQGARFADASQGVLDVSMDSRGCNNTTGTFTVYEIEVTGTAVTKLAVDFVQHCEGVRNPPRPLIGSVRINSSIPPRVALALAVDSGGSVQLAPSGQTCTTNCTAELDLGAIVTMTPAPAPGYVFAGWQGDSDCTDGAVTIVAPVSCTALFDSVITADLVTPGSGSGVTQTFTLDYSSSLGGSDVASAWVWFTPAFSGSSANSCLLHYERATSAFFLVNDAGTGWSALPAGIGTTLQNGQCSIALSTSGGTIIGNTLRVTATIAFKAAATGTRKIFMYAASGTGSNSGWQEKGSWTTSTGVVTADTVSPTSGAGPRRSFTLTYSDTFGGSSLTQGWVWFTPSFNPSSAANSCLAYYERPTNKLFLLNDAGTTWSSASVGSAFQTLQNSQCSFSLPGSFASVSGNSMSVTVTVTFKPSYAGTKQIWMYGTNGAQVSGWQQRGSWTAQPPMVASAAPTPASGTGESQLFSLPYSSNLGATDINRTWVWFNATQANSAAGSCLVYYERPTNRMFLLNDAGTSWQQATMGTAATLENGQCSIAIGGSSTTLFGDILTLKLAMTFKLAFAGPKNIYMYTEAASGTSGWIDRGDWNVTGPISPVTADAASPSAGNTASQTFALTYSSTSGADSLSAAWVWFNATFAPTAAGSCLLYYEPSSSLVHLLNDGGTVWQSAPIGAALTLQNGQCAISLAGTQATVSGNTLTLTLDITFKPAFGGDKNVFLYASSGAANSGWQDRGDWTVPTVVAPVGATPDSGSNASATFALTYSSVNGASDVKTAWVWFNATLAQTAAASCLVYYDQPANALFLLNDAGTSWQSAIVGSNGTLQNSQCSLDLASASIVPNGTTLTVNLPVTFTFSGIKNIYMYAANAQTASGWWDLGDWTVP